MLFNWLSGKIESVELAISTATGEFLDELERSHRAPRAHQRPRMSAAA
jgi:hypothetical protein